MMATEVEKHRLLRDFLADSFTTRELEMWLVLKEEYKQVARAVNPNVAGIEYSWEVVRTLDRQGLVDDVVFQCLAQARPSKSDQIRAVKESWIRKEATSQSPSGGTESSGDGGVIGHQSPSPANQTLKAPEPAKPTTTRSRTRDRTSIPGNLEGPEPEVVSRGGRERTDVASQPDQTYVVFCRIDGIKSIPSDRVAASVAVLAEVVDRAVEATNETLTSHSSVYGRLVLVPGSVVLALDLARTILKESAKRGVPLAVGVACGRVERTQDLLEHNVAGVVVNRAARLAHLDDGEGKIAVEDQVAIDARNANSKHRTAFTSQQHGQVKQTPLVYRWFLTDSTPVGNLPRKRTKVDEPTVHVVVYDIVRFSGLNLNDLRLIVENLRITVSEALRSLGVNDPRRSDGRFWYAPAGDGGVLVFHVGAAAWTFATHLRQQAAAMNLPLRIGISTGTVVTLGNLPVGQGIFEADALSALPPEGAIAASRRFWEKTLEPAHREGWTAHPIEKDDSAWLLSPESPRLRMAIGGKSISSGPDPAQGDDFAASPIRSQSGQDHGVDQSSKGSSARVDEQLAAYRAHARTVLREKLDLLACDGSRGREILGRIAAALGINHPPGAEDRLKESIMNLLLDAKEISAIPGLNELCVRLIQANEPGLADTIAACIDPLLPLYFSWKVIRQATHQLEQKTFVFIKGTVSSGTGADIVMSVYDGASPCFMPHAEEPRGKHAIAVETPPIGDPSLERDACEIVEHILMVLGEPVKKTEQAQVAERLERLRRKLNGILAVYKGHNKRSLYCVLDKQDTDDNARYWYRVLERLRQLVPRLVLIELDPDAPEVEIESGLGYCLRKRFEVGAKRTSA